MIETARGLPIAAALDPVDLEARGVASFAEALACAAATSEGHVALPPRAKPDELRPAVASLLARVAARVEPALIAVLEGARAAWDQADAFSVIDDELEVEIAAARRRLTTSAGAEATAATRAIALEGLLAVDASVALVRLFERRLAALLRLRLRSATRDLLPQGRPFLDLGRALREVAEAWR
ncbi:MAG TPA: hypothetical protein VK989_02555 [Polyangia bacterium]|nr:hypothetical protein [Polyangia bacterium]